MEVFHIIDSDGSGEFSVAEIQKFYEVYDKQIITEEHAKQLLLLLDLDNN